MNRVRNFSDAELSPEEKSAIRLLVSKKILDPSVWTTDNFTDAELLTVCKDALREQVSAAAARTIPSDLAIEDSNMVPDIPHLLDVLMTRLSVMSNSPAPVMLSPTGGMQGQVDQPFGKELFGITEAAMTVAKLADTTFANYAENKVGPNKSYYTMGAVLSGKGTGKSSFLDRHSLLLGKYCQNKTLKKLLLPAHHPLILNLTLNSGTDYSASEGMEPGVNSIARRMVYAYTNADWRSVVRSRADGIVDLGQVLELIVDHHRSVCKMAEADQLVVVVNLDELNQIHTCLDKEAADMRVREVVTALRQLSMMGVTGTVNEGPAVICLLAGTGSVDFVRSMKGSGVEYITQGLPLLNSAEVMNLMEQCRVHKMYLSDPSFLQLLEDTGGVPRVLRKVLEGLTLEFAQSSIADARRNALKYVESSFLDLTTPERAALVPHILLGVPAPSMADLLVEHPSNSRTFEDVRMAGAIFSDNGQLVMPVLVLEALFPVHGPGVATLISRLIYWYRERTWVGFEMFCALYHSLKMQHLSGQPAREVSIGDFYDGARMSPEVASLKIQLDPSAKYEVHGHPTDTKTYQFPGKKKGMNSDRVGKLKQGAILLNGKSAPAGDCILINPLVGGKPGRLLVRSLCIAYTADDKELTLGKVVNDDHKAKKAFEKHSKLFTDGMELVTVHLSNRKPHSDFKEVPDGCVVISRDEVPKFFGPTFQRGLMSPTHTAALRVTDSPRAYSTASRTSGSGLECPSRLPRPVPVLPSCSVIGLRLVRNLARRLLLILFHDAARLCSV